MTKKYAVLPTPIYNGVTYLYINISVFSKLCYAIA